MAYSPHQQRRGVDGLDLQQARTFLAHAGTHRLGAMFSVALACGLQFGEATGLRWEDVDLTSGEIRLPQQLQRVGKQLLPQALKTEKSRRTLALPTVCLEALGTRICTRTCRKKPRRTPRGTWTLFSAARMSVWMSNAEK
jgi:integrase